MNLCFLPIIYLVVTNLKLLTINKTNVVASLVNIEKYFFRDIQFRPMQFLATTPSSLPGIH